MESSFCTAYLVDEEATQDTAIVEDAFMAAHLLEVVLAEGLAASVVEAVVDLAASEVEDLVAEALAEDGKSNLIFAFPSQAKPVSTDQTKAS